MSDGCRLELTFDAAPAGGAVVDALADAARDARDADAKRVLTSLAEAAAAPYLQALRRWCVDGQLDDPYGEFCVAEDVDAEKTAVARDYNASYWDERFTSDAGKAAGGAVTSSPSRAAACASTRRGSSSALGSCMVQRHKPTLNLARADC